MAGNRTGYFAAGGLLRFVSVVALSIFLATISWYLFEKPLTKLKDRLAPSRLLAERAVGVNPDGISALISSPSAIEGSRRLNTC